MKARNFSTWAALIAAVGTVVGGGVGQAKAALLYDNGPLNGLVQAYQLGGAFQCTDSFTLTAPASLTEAQVGLWVNSGDVPNTVDWSIGSAAYGSDLGSASGVALTNTFVASHSNVGPEHLNFDDYESTFPITGTLAAGTYWLTLTNDTPVTSLGVFWDQNSGPSSAFATVVGSAPSESFQIYGDAVPEPASLGLLGLGAAMFLARRRH
ncbi:MAG: PEP-CTERM sorting domain-containing protein [Phycisphaerae bacterium]